MKSRNGRPAVTNPSLLALHPFACKENPHPPPPPQGPVGGWGGGTRFQFFPSLPIPTHIRFKKYQLLWIATYLWGMGCHI